MKAAKSGDASGAVYNFYQGLTAIREIIEIIEIIVLSNGHFS